jgi:flagellar motor switch protein FliM
MTPTILSQSEIDALLSTIPADDAAAPAPSSASQHERDVKPYEFRKPSRLSPDQLRMLEMVHAGFARSLGADLTARLRGAASVSLLSVAQQTYDDFAQSAPIPAALYVLGMEPLPGLAVLELHPNVAFVIVDRLLGGVGRGLARMRELSEVELALMQPIVAQATALLGTAWSQAAEVHPAAQHAVSTTQFLHVAAGSDPVIVATFEARLIETTSRIRICMPCSMLEPLLRPRPLAPTPSDVPATDDALSLRRNLDEVDVPVVALLGSADVTLGDLLGLQEGDFIRLDAPVNRDLDVKVAGKLRFRGRPGLSGRRLAVMVSEAVGKEDAPNDAH